MFTPIQIQIHTLFASSDTVFEHSASKLMTTQPILLHLSWLEKLLSECGTQCHYYSLTDKRCVLHHVSHCVDQENLHEHICFSLVWSIILKVVNLMAKQIILYSTWSKWLRSWYRLWMRAYSMLHFLCLFWRLWMKLSRNRADFSWNVCGQCWILLECTAGILIKPLTIAEPSFLFF